MHAIELSGQWFESAALPVLKEKLPETLPFIAAGIVGRGSESFGFDDALSRDHDFSIGFTIWLTTEAEEKYGFALTRFYQELLKTNPPDVKLSQQSFFGDSEYGVCSIGDFFTRHLGYPGAPADWRQWLYTPEYAFAEAVNGAVFYDGPGVFTNIRKQIAEGMPEDVRLKKIAARAALMAQSGQYNFTRCLKHGERGAAALALAEFVRTAISMIFLLNKSFAPYYKWSFRKLRTLPLLSALAEPLEFLLTEQAPDELKTEIIESICCDVEKELRRQNLSASQETFLEAHALEIMQKIRNREIRSLHIMEG